MRADVAERAGARLRLVEPPRQRRLGVGDPVLEVLRAHVADLADPALGDQLPGQRDRRHPAVGEADHGAYAVGARLVGGGGHRLRLGDGVGQRLLAQHVLAGLEGRDGDLGVGVAGRADVDEVDVVAGDDLRASPSSSRPSPGGRPPRRRGRRRGRRPPPSRGGAGRAKKWGAVRQACEWALPMNACPIIATREGCCGSVMRSPGWWACPPPDGWGAGTRRRSVRRRYAVDQDSKAEPMNWSTLSAVTTGAYSWTVRGTSTSTRSDIDLPWTSRRASLTPSAAWVDG